MSTRNVDELYQPTHNERARQGFVGVLRSHVDREMRPRLERQYQEKILPNMDIKPETGQDVEKLMAPIPYYKFYSATRYNAQEMMYQSVLDPVERTADAMNDVGKRIKANPAAGGTLTLDPNLEMPRYVTALDVHLAPGSFYSEYGPDDLTQGAMLAYGSKVGHGGKVHRESDLGGVGHSIAYWLTQRHPEFAPKRMLDVGTQSGKNLLGYLDHFPNVEAHGVDISAPALRYGHARAEYLGKTVHFSQQDAERLNYPDDHFDLIVSSFFFHELPVSVTKTVLKQCRRLLAPGGIMAHMELPPHADCSPWQNFAWDWDAKYNNEPFYRQFRSQNFAALLQEAGFDEEHCISTVIPNRDTTSAEDYARFLQGELPPLTHGRGGWFIFGGYAPID